MLYHFYKWLFCIGLVIVASVSCAQSFRVGQYTKNDGLPTELTKSVTQDKQGYLWVASDDGLIRFDGHKFTQYKKELPNRYAKSVITTKEGRVFALTDECLHEIISYPDKIDFRLVAQRTFQGEDTILWYPKQLHEDKRGELWVSDHFRPYRLVGDSLVGYNLPDHDKSHDWQRTASFTDDGNGNLVIITQPGRWYRYNQRYNRLDTLCARPFFSGVQAAVDVGSNEFLVGANKQVHWVKFSQDKLVLDSVISNVDAATFHRLSATEVLVGTWSSGLHKVILEGKNRRIEPMRDYNLKAANSIYRSRGGEIWTTSDNGLVLFQHRLFNSPAQFSKQYIQSIRPAVGNGVVYCDGKMVAHVRHEAGELRQQVIYQQAGQTILQAHPVEGGMWLSDADGLILFIDTTGRRTTFDLSQYGGAIFYLMPDAEGNVWFLQDGHFKLGLLRHDGTSRLYGSEAGICSKPLVIKSKRGQLFVGARADTAFLYRYDKEHDYFVNIGRNLAQGVSNDGMSVNDMAFDRARDRIWFGGSIGLYYWENDTVYVGKADEESKRAIKSIAVDYKNNLWLGNPQGLVKYEDGKHIILDEREGIPSKTLTFRTLFVDENYAIWLGTNAGPAVATQITKSANTPTPFFSKVTHEKIIIDPSKENQFLSDELLTFHFLSPTFPARSVRYQWHLQRLGSPVPHWEQVEQVSGIVLNKLPQGQYKLSIRALQQGNYHWSEPLVYRFTVSAVWYQRWVVWLAFFLLLACVMYGVLRYNTYALNKKNEALEREVYLRTAKIIESQRELEKAHQQLENQKIALDETAIVSIADPAGNITYVNDKFCAVSEYTLDELVGKNHNIIRSDLHDKLFFHAMWEQIKVGKWRGEICNRKKSGDKYWVDITIVPFLNKKGKPYQFLAISFDITARKHSEVQMRAQKEEIEEKNNQITSSLYYASRIQSALLRPDLLVREYFSEHFVLFKPLNIVSGDFYWVKKVGDQIITVVADCTGHGVPGAFMSVLGMTLLNDVTNALPNKTNIMPSELLEGMREGVKKSLRQTGKSREQKDGVDLAMCIFNLKEMEMRFAGAFNPAYIVRDGAFITFKATRSPIGIYHKEKPFTTELFKLQTNDRIYMSTDGYPDQFNASGEDRFMRKRFKQLILDNSSKPMLEQRQILEQTLVAWKGDGSQTDDILVAGLKV